MAYTDIITAFQSDPKKGLGQLFEEFGKQLLGYCSHNWHLDEDESHDVLYKTLQIVGKVITRYDFESEAHFKNWLFKIHKNNVLQHLRSKKASEAPIQYSYSDWMQEVSELEDDAFDVSEFKSLIEKVPTELESESPLMSALKTALQQITELERDLLMLRMNNYSYEEISKMLGIENKQLKVKFNRAKSKVEKLTLQILNI